MSSEEKGNDKDRRDTDPDGWQFWLSLILLAGIILFIGWMFWELLSGLFSLWFGPFL